MIPNDHAILLFKFGVEKYMKSLKDGNLFFSCAGNYVQIAKNGGNAEQGDLEEGVFARLLRTDTRVEHCLREFGRDLEITPDGEFVKLRRRSTLLYPLFCMYGYLVSDVLSRDDIHLGTKYYRHDFDPKIFSAFSEDRAGHNVLAVGERKAICVLQPKPFMERLQSIKASPVYQYQSDMIDYQLKSQEEYFIEPTELRRELFFKRPEYEYQHEARVHLVNKKFSTIFESEMIRVPKFSDNDCHIIVGIDPYFKTKANVSKKK